MSKLFEQTIRANRIYYHSSPYKFDRFESRSEYYRGEEGIEAIFLSTNERFVKRFVYLERKPEKLYVYVCRLTRPMNIFNPSSKRDMAKLMESGFDEYILNDVVDSIEDFTVLHDRDLRDWRIMENSRVLRYIAIAGFDGFSVREDYGGKVYENLAVFDPSVLKILGRKRVEIDETGEFHDVPTIDYEFVPKRHYDLKAIADFFTNPKKVVEKLKDGDWKWVNDKIEEVYGFAVEDGIPRGEIEGLMTSLRNLLGARKKR